MLLPKLKKTHELQNEEISTRQERIVSILKGTKMSPDMNSPEVRKHFRNEQHGFNSAKNVGTKKFNKDLIETLARNDSMQYIKDGPKAFLTDAEGSNDVLPGLPTNRNSQINSGSFIGMGLGSKKNSLASPMPSKMDFLSR